VGSTPIQSGWWKKSSDSANPIGAMEAVDVLLKGWVERLQGLRRIHWGTPSEEPTKLEAKHGESWGRFRKSPEFWEVRFWHGSFFLGFQHVDIELKCRNGIKWAYFPFRFIYLNFYRPLNNRLVWDDLGL
jgi:hypothetical protein